MVVQHNITAMNANRYYGINNSKLASSLEKLSSGYKINRAGDDAAGLAVSEKMRSQIAGMTQGVKNAQDGISMVQTFEGALTETHSILQRMKTLADQMANGSYDDPVDRAASQREFLQLNDELDQIADTDYNGVVVLNGGRMADGLEQVDGVFDYKNKASQQAAADAVKLTAAQEEAQKTIDAAQTELNTAAEAVKDAQAAVDAQPKDLSLSGAAEEWNTVDNSAYDKAAAQKLFESALTSPTTAAVDRSNEGNAAGWQGVDSTTYITTAADALFTALETGDTAAPTTLKDAKATDVTVTFKYSKASGDWAVDSGVAHDKDGNEIEVNNLDTVFVAEKVDTNTAGDATGAGGFKVTDGTNDLANAIFDATDLNDGDTVTLTFGSNIAASGTAPANIGLDGAAAVDGSFTTDGTNDLTNIQVVGTLDASLKDEAMTSGYIKNALDSINNKDIVVTGNGTSAVTVGIDGTTLSTTSTTGTKVGENLYATWDGKGVITLYAADSSDATITNIGTQTTVKKQLLGTYEIQAGATPATLTAAFNQASNGTITATMAVSTAKFVDGAGSLEVKAGKNDELDSISDMSNAEKMDVTFTAKVDDAGNVTWETTSGTATIDGKEVGVANVADILTTAVPKGGEGTNGGFAVKNNGEVIANAILDSSNVKTGDTVTLTFTQPGSGNDAPDNIGFANDSVIYTANSTAVTSAKNPTIKLADTLDDASMNKKVDDALTALEGATITATYDGTGKVDGLRISNDTEGTAISIDSTNGGASSGKITFNGVDLYITAAADYNGFTISTLADGATAAADQDLMTFTYAVLNGEDDGDKVAATIALDSHKYDPEVKTYTVQAGTDKNLAGTQGTASALQTALQSAKDAQAAAQKKLDDANAAYPKSAAELKESGVSKSDAFDNSEAIMTYTDHITLQVGARTKDAVDFTFTYDSDSIGDLAGDLNCTAKGLGTADLTIATQEDANYAIDKIDQAINKVSLIRGNFGAIQNRLNHKIDNMNVSIENLTDAESQIRDTDMSTEMMEFTKNQILAQASQSMLAQANQLPQSVLSLLQ